MRCGRLEEKQRETGKLLRTIQKSIVLDLSAGSANREKGSDSRHGLKAGLAGHADRLE